MTGGDGPAANALIPLIQASMASLAAPPLDDETVRATQEAIEGRPPGRP
jgi:hypothetical protein